MKIANPATLPRGPRRFVAYLLQDVAVRLQKHGFLSLVPIVAIICAAVGASVGVYASDKFFEKIEAVIAFYAAILTLNAIILAICWSSFSKVFEIIGDSDFGPWLRLRNMDSYYGFYVDFIHLVQMIAVITVAAGMVVSLLVDVLRVTERGLLGAALATTAYAMWWASGCVRLMQELAEHRATYKQSRDGVQGLGNGNPSRGQQ